MCIEKLPVFVFNLVSTYITPPTLIFWLFHWFQLQSYINLILNFFHIGSLPEVRVTSYSAKNQQSRLQGKYTTKSLQS